MDIEQMRSYCLSRQGATEDFPFDEETLVIRVMNKIFAIIPLERGACISLKCDPDKVEAHMFASELSNFTVEY